jgi:hypothetical protein
MRPFADELGSRSREDGSRLPLAVGAILTLIALVCFYASLAVHICVSAVRNRFSPSILRAYAAALGLVALFSLASLSPASEAPAWAVSLTAGNVLFPAVLLGWIVGDRLRLRGRI